jgi:alpha-beta hydrolase superfamily lysophospholipase
MRIVRETQFAPRRDEATIIVHAQPDRTNAALVLLVHGLGGSRYGTWGDLPRYLHSDEFPADVGACSYDSGHRRLLHRHTPDFSFLAQVLADEIRDTPEYSQVLLVGHSMGGLLCMAVIKHLIDVDAMSDDEEPITRRIAGLFLLATPQAGSLRSKRLFARFSSDAAVLRAHGSTVRELQSTFINRVAKSESQSRGNLILIPTYALVAGRDAWVDRFSAGLGIPDSHQRRVAEATHMSIVKPDSQEDDAYKWLVSRLSLCVRKAIVRQPRLARSILERGPGAANSRL